MKVSGRRVPGVPFNGRNDRDEDLLLFKELHKREKDRLASLLQPVSDEFEPNGGIYMYYIHIKVIMISPKQGFNNYVIFLMIYKHVALFNQVVINIQGIIQSTELHPGRKDLDTNSLVKMIKMIMIGNYQLVNYLFLCLLILWSTSIINPTHKNIYLLLYLYVQVENATSNSSIPFLRNGSKCPTTRCSTGDTYHSTSFTGMLFF